MRSGFYKYSFLLVCFLAISVSVSGQSYGLGFVSNEAVQDERTGLDLSPESALCFNSNFRISFDIAFVPNQHEYFGYIVRIIDNRDKNIDLISNNGSPIRQLTLVNGTTSINLPADLSRTDVSEKWNRIDLEFNLANQTITCSMLGKKHTAKVSVGKGNCFKVLFGANNVPHFKTTDVPPMKIRDVRIYETNKLKGRWLLNEEEGNIAEEEILKKDALVNNPSWIKKTHQNWKLIKEFTAEGPISVASNASQESLYFVGLDSLQIFSYAGGQLRSTPYSSGRLNLLRGNQSYYDEDNGKLYNIYLDQSIITSYNFESNSWDNNFTIPVPITDNWQYNKFYSTADSSFYMLGGYGHFLYKNEIRRYHLPTKSWQLVKPPAKTFVPRYLAALGRVEGGAYLLGGYGTESGQQIHNPTSLYDLLYFNTKNRSIKKVNELKVHTEDFVFANSMVINEKARSYYALTFSKHKFNSTLQLIKGSLDSSSFTAVADTIPYHFYDINSFADLYYYPKSKRFIAVTLFLNTKNQTEVAIYSLAGPPLVVGQTVIGVTPQIPVFGILLAILVVAGLSLAYYYRKKILEWRSSDGGRTGAAPISGKAGEINDHSTSGGMFNKQGLSADTLHKDVIFLFGDFQLFDHRGNDITKYFTPLIKELFLVILLYSLRWERGISSEKLKELLWFDKTVESARNNRSVNIAKLKTILDNMEHCEISKETGYWKANIDFSKITVDYHIYLSIIKDKRELNKQKIQELAEIIQRGSFLSNLEYEWLDSFKSEISNQVIDIYQHFANSIEISKDPEFLIEIANYIFYFDTVNEEAMMLKCKALVHLGKHSLAKGAFENFRKEYKIIYGEEFSKDFHAILE